MTRDRAPQAYENLRPTLDLNGSELLAAGFIDDLAIRVIRAFLAGRLTLRTITGCQILRRQPSENEHALNILEADTDSTATTFTDTTVTADILHVYRVKAINSAGVGQRSRNVNVTP